MAPTKSKIGQMHDRSKSLARKPPNASEAERSKSAPPPHHSPFLNPRVNRAAQAPSPGTKSLQISDHDHTSASGASLVPCQASSPKPWLSRPFMPDRAEVQKLLITISSSNTRILKHIHASESSDIFLVEHGGQERILKVVCSDLNVAFQFTHQKS
jgi:hypothetical protein